MVGARSGAGGGGTRDLEQPETPHLHCRCLGSPFPRLG